MAGYTSAEELDRAVLTDDYTDVTETVTLYAGWVDIQFAVSEVTIEGRANVGEMLTAMVDDKATGKKNYQWFIAEQEDMYGTAQKKLLLEKHMNYDSYQMRRYRKAGCR